MISRIFRITSMGFALAAAILAFAVPSQADSQSVSGCGNCNGYAFQANLTQTAPNTYALTYTITNVSGATVNPYNWSLTLFGNGSNVNATNLSMSDGNQSAYYVGDGKSNNGNTNCNGAIGGAVCVEPTGSGTLSQLSKGQSLTFTISITCVSCTELSNWIFLSSGYCTDGSKCYAISTPGTGGNTVGVPEPSSWALYASTILAMGAFVWMFRRKARTLENIGFNPVC